MTVKDRDPDLRQVRRNRATGGMGRRDDGRSRASRLRESAQRRVKPLGLPVRLAQVRDGHGAVEHGEKSIATLELVYQLRIDARRPVLGQLKKGAI